MERWDDFLPQHGPRQPLQAPEGLQKLEPLGPAIFQGSAELHTVWIALRLLQVLTQRQGAACSPQVLQTMLTRHERALEPQAQHLADEEVRRILRWLQAPSSPDQAPAHSPHPELEWMSQDLEARQEIFSLAISRQQDLELEYYDIDQDLWPRLRLRPVSLLTEPEPTMTFLERDQPLHIPVKHVRWLVPVHRPKAQPAPKARVLTFPLSPQED